MISMTCRKNLFLNLNFMFKYFGKHSLYKTSDLSNDYFSNKVAIAFSCFLIPMVMCWFCEPLTLTTYLTLLSKFNCAFSGFVFYSKNAIMQI